MQKKIRRLLTLLISLLLLLSLGMWLLADPLLHRSIELAGTRMLGVKVQIEDFQGAYRQGVFFLYNLTIDNPPGYENKTLLHIDQVKISLDMDSLRQAAFAIHQIQIQRLELLVEQNNLTSNLQEITERLPHPHDPNRTMGHACRVDHLDIVEVCVRAQVSALPGQQDLLRLDLPTLHLEHLGYDYPMDVPILSGRIMSSLTDQILQTDALFDPLLRQSRSWAHHAHQVFHDPNSLGETLLDGLKGLFKPPPGETEQPERLK